jgi:hypothetical protein
VPGDSCALPARRHSQKRIALWRHRNADGLRPVSSQAKTSSIRYAVVYGRHTRQIRPTRKLERFYLALRSAVLTMFSIPVDQSIIRDNRSNPPTHEDQT